MTTQNTSSCGLGLNRIPHSAVPFCDGFVVYLTTPSVTQTA